MQGRALAADNGQLQRQLAEARAAAGSGAAAAAAAPGGTASQPPQPENGRRMRPVAAEAVEAEAADPSAEPPLRDSTAGEDLMPDPQPRGDPAASRLSVCQWLAVSQFAPDGQNTWCRAAARQTADLGASLSVFCSTFVSIVLLRLQRLDAAGARQSALASDSKKLCYVDEWGWTD